MKVGLGTCTGSLAYMCRLRQTFSQIDAPGGRLCVSRVWCVHVRACGMQSFWLPAAQQKTDAAMRQSRKELTDLPLVAPRSDGQPYLLCSRRRARMREAWPLPQTPAVVFEQHTTPCLKISRVESTVVVARHLCPPNTKPLDAACRRITLLADPPMTCTYGDAPAWVWLAGWQPRQPALASTRRMSED